MPSPFPGIDPFVESQMWDDFHARFVTIISEMLVPRVRPQYMVNVERYVYLTQPDDDDEVVKIIAPDVFVSDTGHGWREYAGGAVATLAPVRNRLPMPKRCYLQLRRRRGAAARRVPSMPSPLTWDSAGPDLIWDSPAALTWDAMAPNPNRLMAR